MSTALAMGAVTGALKDVLKEAYSAAQLRSDIVGNVTITAQAPATISLSDNKTQLNVFLYQVSTNKGWNNIQQPTRDDRGQRVTAPPLPLDLYYMLTAYSEKDLEAETLLGLAMQLLHEQPGFGRRQLRDIASRSTDSESAELRRILASSNLAEQQELVKFSLQSLNSDEMSKLWTSFQAQYRPSVAYHASVVLIESDVPTRAALPVKERQVHVYQLHQPRINSVSPQIILPGETLTLIGSSLLATTVQLVFGGQEPLSPIEVNDQKISVMLPGGLHAGVNTVQVVHPVDVNPGPDADLRRGAGSNVAAFMLAPRITHFPTGAVNYDAEVTFEVDPSVRSDQRVELLLGDQSFPRTLDTPPPDTAPELTHEVQFKLNLDEGGDYLTRIRVDGAESALVIDTDPDSATYNQYIGPLTTVNPVPRPTA